MSVFYGAIINYILSCKPKQKQNQQCIDQKYSNDHFPFYITRLFQIILIKVLKLCSKTFMYEIHKYIMYQQMVVCYFKKACGKVDHCNKRKRSIYKVPLGKLLFGKILWETIFGTWYLNPLDKITLLL